MTEYIGGHEGIISLFEYSNEDRLQVDAIGNRSTDDITMTS